MSMSNLHATINFVQQTVAEDFGEPLYPFPISRDDSMEEEGGSSTDGSNEVRDCCGYGTPSSNTLTPAVTDGTETASFEDKPHVVRAGGTDLKGPCYV